MGIRRILVHLEYGEHLRARVETAAALALAHDAHLVGLAPTGRVAAPADCTGAPVVPAYENAATAVLLDQAQGCVDSFMRQVQHLGVPFYEAKVAATDGGRALASAARYCDLTVVTRGTPGEAAPSSELVQDVLLHSGRPVLVLPPLGAHVRLAAHPVIVAGWNASREAARAMHDALAFFRCASRVQIVAFNETEDRPSSPHDLPGADIAAWLSRHGVKADFETANTARDVAQGLITYSQAMGADLLVVGGYGHSRLLESILGGVTRTLLRNSPIPLLMSH